MTSTLAAWLHDLDPFLVEFPQAVQEMGFIPEGLRWYGMAYAAGFIVAYLIIHTLSKRRVIALPVQASLDLIVTVAFGLLIGGRVGYVLFYEPSLLMDSVDGPPWWAAIAINHGGMSSHGGMLGGVVGMLIIARRYQLPLGHLLDISSLVAPIGIAFGRLANFINGELLGRPSSPNFALAVKFPQEMLDWSEEQIAEAITRFNESSNLIFTGDLTQFPYYAISQIQAGDAMMKSIVEPLLTPRHPSQLYAMVSEGIIVFAAAVIASGYFSQQRLLNRPWLVSGVAVTTYAVMRIVNEFFRLPDDHLIEREFALTGISRGQWISGVMFLIGVGLVVYALNAKTPSGQDAKEEEE